MVPQLGDRSVTMFPPRHSEMATGPEPFGW